VLVARSFVRNRCPVRASALSYATLLALIPMLAVAISVTSSLLKKEGEERIYHFIDRLVSSVMPPATLGANAPAHSANPGTHSFLAPGSLSSSQLPSTNESTSGDAPAITKSAPATGSDDSSLAMAPSGETNTPSLSGADDARVAAAQKEAARRIHEFVQNTRSGTLGITGMVVLVFVAISMLSRIEETFNDIWGVTCGRNWLMRIVLYWTAITLGPLLLVGAAGLASGPHLQTTQNLISKMPFVGGFLFKLLPLVLLWLTFTLLYQLVPNTKVRFSAALVGGILGGTLWQVNNVFGFLYVSRVVTNSKIYGSLGLVPVFMAGLYLSWLILLFGAQVAYAFQNRSLYLQEKIAENVNQRGREFVALRLMTSIGQRFHRGLPAATIHEMSSELGIPSRLSQQVLQTLIAAHIVIEISGVEPAYVPARPLETINAHHVLQAMRATQGHELITRDEPLRQEVYGEFARIQEAEKQAASTLTMLALVNRAEARLELEGPAPPGQELKLKPALVPTIEPTPDPSTDKDRGVPL
jgi:membrane protein